MLVLAGDKEIRYSERTYSGVLDDFYSLIASELPAWTDHNPYDPGVLLAGYTSRVASFLNFYIDRRAEENYPETARLLSSMRRIGSFTGFVPRNPTTASVDVVFSVTAPGVIPRLFTVSSPPSGSQKAVYYETLADFTATAAGTYVLTCHHGLTRENVLIGRGQGLPSQEITIKETPVALSSSGYPEIQLDVLEGETWVRWTRVQNFLDSTTTSRHFTVKYNDLSELVIQCGDGLLGKIWPVSSSDLNIRATYRVGGGVLGNTPGRGTITQIANARGCVIVSSVMNTSVPSGGSDAETLEEAKIRLPLQRSLRGDVITTFADIRSSLLNSSLGISRVRVDKGRYPYEVYVTIAASGVNPRTSGYWDNWSQSGAGLLGAAGAYVKARCSDPWIIYMRSALPVPVLSTIEVHCASWAYQRDVRKAVSDAVDTFLTGHDFQSVARLTEYIQALESIDNVDYVEVPRFTRVPRATFVQGSDSAVFSNFRVTEKITDEVWTVRFIDTNRFKVTGAASREQHTLGVCNSPQPFVTDTGSLSFRVTTDANNTPGFGTVYTIRTCKMAGTVTADRHEIITNGGALITLIGGLQ